MLPVKKILCPVDFSGASQVALQAAGEFAEHFGAELILVHVVPVVPALPDDPNYTFSVPEYERALHAGAERQLDAMVEGFAPKGIAARSIVGHGDAGAQIVCVADTEAADFIIIATHGMTGWRHVVFGSVAEKVVRLARRPVLTVPAAAD